MKKRNLYARQAAWRERNPWARFVEWARWRCNDVAHRNYKFYGALGISVKLTALEARVLWERDGAAQMKTPSLDRIDSACDYVFENCRFIEKAINERLPHLLREEREEIEETLPGWLVCNFCDSDHIPTGIGDGCIYAF